MLVALFRSNRPAVLLVLLVLVPALFWPWMQGVPLPTRPVMPLQQVLNHLLGLNNWVRAGLGIAWILLICIQLSSLVNSCELMERRNYLPALFFPLLLAAFGDSFAMGPALAGMPFVLLALRRSWTMTNMGSVLSPLFDAGLLIGIASLFFLPYAFLVVVIWASVSVIRPFAWREHLVPLFGVAIALYMAWGVLKLMGVDHWRPLFTIMDRSYGAVLSAYSPQLVLFYFLAGGFVLIGSLSFAKVYGKSIMREKNLRSAFLSYTAATVVLVVMLWLLSKRFPPVLLAVPLAVFCSYAVQNSKRSWIGELAVLALITLAGWGMWG